MTFFVTIFSLTTFLIDVFDFWSVYLIDTDLDLILSQNEDESISDANRIVLSLSQKRPEILAQNPKAKVTEVVKEIARCWSLMSKEDRMAYKLEAKRDKERYEKELKSLEN